MTKPKSTGKFAGLRPADNPEPQAGEADAPQQPTEAPEPAADPVARIRAQRPRATEPSEATTRAPVYGRRADPTYAQLNATIPADLKTKLKRHTLEQGVTISELIEALLADYLTDE